MSMFIFYGLVGAAVGSATVWLMNRQRSNSAKGE